MNMGRCHSPLALTFSQIPRRHLSLLATSFFCHDAPQHWSHYSHKSYKHFKHCSLSFLWSWFKSICWNMQEMGKYEVVNCSQQQPFSFVWPCLTCTSINMLHFCSLGTFQGIPYCDGDHHSWHWIKMTSRRFGHFVDLETPSPYPAWKWGSHAVVKREVEEE